MTVGKYTIGRRVLDALRTDRPMSAGEVAVVAQCNTETARGWLEMLAAAGVACRAQRGFRGCTGVRPVEFWRAKEWGGA